MLEIWHGAVVENIFTNVHMKFNDDRLQSKKVLVLWKPDNNDSSKNNIRSHWGPIPVCQKIWPKNNQLAFKHEISSWQYS